MATTLINANPTVVAEVDLPSRSASRRPDDPFADVIPQISAFLDSFEAGRHTKEGVTQREKDVDPIDAQEVYDLISSISDPEHPLSLSQLSVVNLDDIHVVDGRATGQKSTVTIDITPTIPHCSMATLIGLCVRVRLERALPSRFRVDVRVRKGSHQSETQVNRQLADKERVAAACENEQLMSVLSGMMETCK